MESFQIRATSAPWRSAVELLILQRTDDGLRAVKEVTTEKVDLYATTPPSMIIPVEAAQVLMDDLWISGLRPTEGAGSAGAMLAAESHLKDLRKIAFKALKIRD